MIRLEQAHFSFGGKPILDGVSLLVPEGARVGLLGRNGAGKTTLFRLILGELPLESGSITVPRQRRLVFLPQHPSSPPEETILRHVLQSHPTLRDTEDDLLRLERRMEEETDPGRLDRLVERHRALSRDFEARGGYVLEARVSAILKGLGFQRGDFLKEIRLLSPGEKNRVAIAKVLLADADVLLLDEPTNHLDFEMVEWLEEYLEAPPRSDAPAPVTLLVASHDRYFLNRVATHVLELRGAHLHAYRGNYDDFARQRAEELDRQEKEHRLQQREIERDLEFIRRNFAAQKARQAKSREKRLERMERVERPLHEAAGPRIRFHLTAKAGESVLRLDGVTCGHGNGVLLRDVRMELARGERVAIVGPNGSGKTTLLKCIWGALAPLGGKVERGPRTVMGYYEQDLSHAGSPTSLFDEIHDLVPQWTNLEVRDLLAAFLFRGDEIFLPTSGLSGGEKARLALIRLILSGANLLILDEPTNHLDVYARAALEESLLEFPGTILFVSHDRYFVERVADRVFGVQDLELRELLGGYEEYRESCRQGRLELEARRKAERVRASAPSSGKEPPPTRAKRSEEEKLLKSLSLMEAELKDKREQCGLEMNYRNPEAMRKLKHDIASLEKAVEALYRQWEELMGT
jgi:ATP-binding cassette subfamily F protein 3